MGKVRTGERCVGWSWGLGLAVGVFGALFDDVDFGEGEGELVGHGLFFGVMDAGGFVFEFVEIVEKVFEDFDALFEGVLAGGI